MNLDVVYWLFKADENKWLGKRIGEVWGAHGSTREAANEFALRHFLVAGQKYCIVNATRGYISFFVAESAAAPVTLKPLGRRSGR